MRYMGIDYGTKRVGVALSDEAGTMGFPVKILGNDARLIDELLDIIEHDEVGVIVIGESRNYQGKDNAIAAPARGLGEVLGKSAGIPVVYEPEMLTTQEARRLPDGTRDSHAVVDASAAALILTSYLSHLTNE
ncbi:MAG TPA: Holliday junction resolvase RuvX [Candidatus Paceibacterota bacterium]|nr:Holliday junction resolvase RuvX [Candidatus Paceibacterota bacterium]